MAAPDRDNFLLAYKKLPTKSPATIRLFERSTDKFTVYSDDALYITKELSHTHSACGLRKLHNADLGLTVDYYNIPRSISDATMRDLLLLKQRRVEVWVNKGGGSGGKWVAEYKGSPGNLLQFEDLIFSNVPGGGGVPVNNGVVGVRIGIAASVEKNKVIGLAYANTNECILHLVEFIDNESFTNLESILVQLGPKEAVIPASVGSSGGEDLNAIQKVLSRNAIMINQKKQSDFDAKDLCQDLQRLVQQKDGQLPTIAAHPDMQKQLATQALASVIKYLELLSHDTYFNQFRIVPFDFNLYVKMDAAAIQALHLNPPETGSRNVSLASVVDKCRTAQGHRLLAQLLRQPIVDKDKLEERLDLVETFKENIALLHSMSEEHLKRVPDCQALGRRFGKRKAGLQDCYKSYLCLVKLPQLVKELESASTTEKKKTSLATNFIDPLKTLLKEFDKFVEMIKTTLDLELAEQGEFMVRPDFDDSLQNLRKEMNTVKSQMENEARAVAHAVKAEEKSIKLESNTKDGWYFRVTLKDEKAIRNKNEYMVLDTNKSGVRFRNRKLELLNEKYQKRTSSYQDLQKEFLSEIMDISAGYHLNFQQLGSILAYLDVMISFAFVASNGSYVRPVLHPSGTGKIDFKQLRHPCIEAQVNYIPNDISFEKGKQSFFIITGPNMGGKSTFLRSVGVATLLAHVGSFIPAEHAEVSLVDAILARIGASDCLEKGVSTFMAEMIESAFILNTATENSLVLVDELGRGTSTFDGFGLCWAISHRLASTTNSFTIVATHFHELTALADELPTVVHNLHVTALADTNGLAMLYKLEDGVCDRSFGLHVAKVVGFPDDVVKMAQEMAEKLEDYSEDVDGQDDSEVAVTKRRKLKEDGHSVIDKFLKNLAEIQKNSTSNEEFKLQAKNVLDKLKECDNPYITHLIKN